MTAEELVNPKFAETLKQADAFIGSLIFDYDDVSRFTTIVLVLSIQFD